MTHRRIEVPSSETICRTAKNFLAEPVATKEPHCLFFRIIRKGLPLIRKGLPCQALRLIDASRRWRSCPRMSHLGAKAGLREAGIERSGRAATSNAEGKRCFINELVAALFYPLPNHNFLNGLLPYLGIAVNSRRK